MSMQELTPRVVCVCAVLGALLVGGGPGNFFFVWGQEKEGKVLVTILF